LLSGYGADPTTAGGGFAPGRNARSVAASPARIVHLESLLREAEDHADGTRLPRLAADVSRVRGARLPPSHRPGGTPGALLEEPRVPRPTPWHRGRGCSASGH